MDIVFTHNGDRYVIPFSADFQPSKFGLRLVRQEYPDAEFSDQVDDDAYHEAQIIGAAHFTACKMKADADV